MPVSENYTKELRREYGYSATWFPTTQLKLGDVGRLRGYEFDRLTSLNELGVRFRQSPNATTADLDYTSKDGVSLEFEAAGAALGATLTKAQAQVKVTFHRDNAILLRASGCIVKSIALQGRLEADVISLLKAGVWKRDYVVVTELIQANRMTLLISSSSDASMVIGVDGALQADRLDLASASLGLDVVASHHIGTMIIARNHLTPLFRAKGIRTTLFRNPRLEREMLAQMGEEDSRTRLDLAEVDYEDFDLSWS